MRTDKIRKYLIPNIPYLFILWAFLKLGTAYRLAEGNDFAHKLIGLGQTIGPAFADFAPGLAPLDWLVGIVGAVGFRLLIYFKSKNAKKFRRDAEYGSARCEKLMEQLSQRLSKEDYELVQELRAQTAIAQCEESESHFKYGFSAGLMFSRKPMNKCSRRKKNR